MLNYSTCATTTGTAPQLFASAINFLAATQCFIPDNTCSNDVPDDLETFDFIVVGGGSAGSVVASRLSEIIQWKVLLLEAGPKPPIESDIPYLAGSLQQTKYDWQYITKTDGVKQQALKNGELRWPRGKMLGGSSSINYMIYVKGRDHDYQSWADEGNPSWSLQNVNYYSKKAENLQDMELNKDPIIYESYGHTGPLVVNSHNDSLRDITEKVLDSWDYIGVKKVPDINAAKFTGNGLSGISRVTANSGQRVNTYGAYLKNINRPNLKIVTEAFVMKVLINKRARAYGVEVDVKGKRKTYYANRDVILSAGAINTPQLLMLSGIGAKKHLATKNIGCVVDLPGVGKNLQDHSSIPVIIYGDAPESENIAEQTFDTVKYLYNKTGHLAHGALSDMVAFYSRHKNMKYPEFQSHHVLFRKSSSTIRDFFNSYKEDVVDSIIRFNSNKALYMVSVHVLHPFSKGAIYLNTSNPYDHPIINPNYLGDKRDIQSSADAIKIIANLLETPYFKSINAFMPRIKIPQCSKFKFPSDLYWKCYSIHMSATTYHPVGTAKMGPDPRHSVVDNILKVHGVTNLRVIDASIMPYETSGNTNAPTIMIAELGSDMIKDEYLFV